MYGPVAFPAHPLDLLTGPGLFVDVGNDRTKPRIGAGRFKLSFLARPQAMDCCFFFNPNDAVIGSRHTDIRREAGITREYSFVPGRAMGMGSVDERRSTCQVLRQPLLFARGLGVDIDDPNFYALRYPTKQHIDRFERATILAVHECFAD